ncbi:hypothetical protein, partial [Bifidobacterium pseudocatenulatum]|uniref:hypothetical protein n=1 Tax=Bifidobacterium pseudocatenulatum TaxID=28026 RepID=UPI001F376448
DKPTAQSHSTQIGHDETRREPLQTLENVGVSKTREKRAADAIAWRKTVGKTLKHLIANQHPGVSQPHYPFTAHPPSQPIRENLPAES